MQHSGFFIEATPRNILSKRREPGRDADRSHAKDEAMAGGQDDVTAGMGTCDGYDDGLLRPKDLRNCSAASRLSGSQN
jgi:hypothetical protein